MAKTNKPTPGNQPAPQPRQPTRPNSSPPPNYRRKKRIQHQGGCTGCGKRR